MSLSICRDKAFRLSGRLRTIVPEGAFFFTVTVMLRIVPGWHAARQGFTSPVEWSDEAQAAAGRFSGGRADFIAHCRRPLRSLQAHETVARHAGSDCGD